MTEMDRLFQRNFIGISMFRAPGNKYDLRDSPRGASAGYSFGQRRAFGMLYYGSFMFSNAKFLLSDLRMHFLATSG